MSDPNRPAADGAAPDPLDLRRGAADGDARTALPPPGLPDPQPDLLALDEHGRAIALAAQRPTEPLGPVDDAWLAVHLEACDACRAVAAGYESDRLLLRNLRDRVPQPPRDLWARTAAALDREAQRPVRIRRASLPPRPAAPYPRPAWSPGLLSGILVVALVAGTSLLATLGPALLPRPSAPAATPIAVSADVRWIQAGTDGSFDIVLGQVDQVCPASDPTACGPLTDVSRTSITLGAPPRSVALSPNSGQLVVVAGNSGTGGGAVYVVPVPSAPARPTRSPAVSATLASGSPRASGSPAASALASALPATAAVAIADGVIVVGGSAGHSPDGRWFAFAARPADGSAGPDIYAWRVGDARATAITDDHRSIFSGWLGDRILGSRIDDEPVVPGASPGPSASPGPGGGPGSSSPLPSGLVPAPSTAPGAPTATPGATPTQLTSPAPEATTTAGATPQAVLTPGPAATRTPSPTTSNSARASGSGAAPSSRPSGSPAVGANARPTASAIASIRPGFVVAMERGVTSFLLDPETGAMEDLPAARYLRPVVDPTGEWVAYWEGTVATDAEGVDWMPGTGRLVVARWVPIDAATPSASPGASPAPSGAPGSPAPSLAIASATPSGSLVPATASSSPGPAATLAASGVASSPRPSATPSVPGASAQAPGSADPDRPPAASPVASGSPEPAGPRSLADGPMLDFDVAFDPTGTHLAVWIADPTDPAAGTLTLLNLSDGSWSPDRDHPLVAVPALRGFAIGESELVWVTPPDAGGQGSRIEVVGWTRDGYGSVQSLAGGALIVVR